MKFDFWSDDPAAAGRFCSFTAVAAAATSASASAAAGAAGAAAASGAAVGSFSAIPAVSAATGIAGASTVAGSGFGLLDAFSVASGIFSIASGFQQANIQNAQAQLESLRAESELIEGERAIVEEKEQFVIDLASFRAAQAGSGNVTSSGSVGAAQAAAVKDLNSQVNLTRSGARIRAATRRASASNLRSAASGSIISGFAGAAQVAANRIDRRQRRG